MYKPVHENIIKLFKVDILLSRKEYIYKNQFNPFYLTESDDKFDHQIVKENFSNTKSDFIEKDSIGLFVNQQFIIQNHFVVIFIFCFCDRLRIFKCKLQWQSINL